MRWALKGLAKGQIKLETVKIGGRRYTSRAALEAFAARLTEGEGSPMSAQGSGASHCKAERDCERAGL
jgi:hypothetical protein